MNRWYYFTALAVMIFSLAALARITLALQPGLWADEIFSLAMATGHSLEHPASEANSTFGDYIEPPEARPGTEFKGYLQHDKSPAGPQRVIRAVFLSDTSPPLYYLLLNLWTRVTGTSDAALRLFSVLWALACFPLIWLVGKKIEGKQTAWIACILFSCAPAALYYSTEGRMYSLLWFLDLSLAQLSFLIARRGPRPHLFLLWSINAAAGLLTHYFFVFLFSACFAWLVLHPGKMSRVQPFAMAALTGLLVLPWYIHIPESLTLWRVTAGWLDYPLSLKQALSAPFLLMWSFLSGRGIWGGSVWVDRFAAGIYMVLAIITVWQGFARLLGKHRQLLWLWLLGACLGPLIFDLIRNTNASLIARYALPGLPAGLLLAAMVINWLPHRFKVTIVALIILAWVPGIQGVFSKPSRPGEPFPEVVNRIAAQAKPCDLVIVHSTPSGVLGIARYLNTKTPIASWVVQLNQRRVHEDMNKLVTGREKIALVKIHYVGEKSPAEEWLRAHTTLERQEKLHSSTEILYFQSKPPADKSENR